MHLSVFSGRGSLVLPVSCIFHCSAFRKMVAFEQCRRSWNRNCRKSRTQSFRTRRRTRVSGRGIPIKTRDLSEPFTNQDALGSPVQHQPQTDPLRPGPNLHFNKSQATTPQFRPFLPEKPGFRVTNLLGLRFPVQEQSNKLPIPELWVQNRAHRT